MSAFCRLLATLFPGGYRFISVYLVAFFCSSPVSAFYSGAFFTVSLLATFSGMAVATQSFVRGRNLPLGSRLAVMSVLLIISALPAQALWQHGLHEYLAVVLCAWCYSGFEIVRSDLAAEGEFQRIVWAGVLACLLLALSLFTLAGQQVWLTLGIFSSLLVSLMAVRKPLTVTGRLDREVYRDIGSYSLSNGLSSGLSFLLPLLLARELNSAADSVTLAKVFTLATLFLFYPRYLSAKFLVDYKHCQQQATVVSFERRVQVYVAGISCCYVLLTLLLSPDYFQFSVLFVSVLATQLSLPVANAMMVRGQGKLMLTVNLIVFLVLALMWGAIYLCVDSVTMRVSLIMLAYFAYVLVRTLVYRVVFFRGQVTPAGAV